MSIVRFVVGVWALAAITAAMLASVLVAVAVTTDEVSS